MTGKEIGSREQEKMGELLREWKGVARAVAQVCAAEHIQK